MSKIKTILCDMDMILVDMIKVWIKKYNETTGENVQEVDIKEYELRQYTQKPEILDKILSQKDFFLEMRPIQNSCKYVTKLIDDGYDVVIVTQLPRRANHWAARDKRTWLEKRIPKLDLSQVIFAHRKDLIDGDMLIDDSPHHLISWHEKHPNGVRLTIDYPYNQSIQVDGRFSKQTAWEEIYEYIKKHS